MASPEVRVRSWVRANDDEVRSGMLGYLSVHFGGLVLDGIVLRKTTDGQFTLSSPARTDRTGRRHPYFRPADDNARREIECEILGQLGQRQDLDVATEDRDE